MLPACRLQIPFHASELIQQSSFYCGDLRQVVSLRGHTSQVTWVSVEACNPANYFKGEK